MTPRPIKGNGDNDNVIYLNFGRKERVSPPPTPRAPAGAQSTAPENTQADQTSETNNETDTAYPKTTGISTAVDNLILQYAEEGRYKRGKGYARAGNVVDLSFRDGAIHGRVAGSQNEPFSVLFQLPYVDGSPRERVTELLAQTPNGLNLVREGSFPQDLINLILGDDSFQLKIFCDCPDYERVCKHVVAVALRMVARIESDPLQLLALRGVNLATTDQEVLVHAEALAQKSAEDLTEEERDDADIRAERNRLFWEGRALPEMPRPKLAPALDDSDPELLRKAMRAVSYTNIDLLRAISDVEDLYHGLTH